jgi:hypothetical protein
MLLKYILDFIRVSGDIFVVLLEYKQDMRINNV